MEFMTVEEIAGELRVDQRTVRRWIVSGLLVATRVGRQYRIRKSDYQAFLKAKEKPETESRSLAGALFA